MSGCKGPSVNRTLGKEAALEHRVHIRTTVDIVVAGHLVATIIRHTITLQQVVEDAHIGLRANNVGHIGKRGHHFVHAMHKTVHALDVLLGNLRAVHRGIATLTLRCVVIQEVIVAVGNLLVGHEALDEVNHRHRRHVVHDDHVVTVLIHLPVNGVGHVLLLQDGHRVIDGQRRRTTHTVTLDGTFRTRKGLHLVAVVNHGTEDQHLLLCQREVLIAANSPVVLLEEPLEGSIICHKERLRTCLVQYLPVAKIVNQAHRVGVIPLSIHPTVDAHSPTCWGTLIKVVFRTRQEGTATNQQHSGSQR